MQSMVKHHQNLLDGKKREGHETNECIRSFISRTDVKYFVDGYFFS